MDLDTAADIKFYAIPDLQKRLKELEVKKAEKEASGEVSSDFECRLHDDFPGVNLDADDPSYFSSRFPTPTSSLPTRSLRS